RALDLGAALEQAHAQLLQQWRRAHAGNEGLRAIRRQRRFPAVGEAVAIVDDSRDRPGAAVLQRRELQPAVAEVEQPAAHAATRRLTSPACTSCSCWPTDRKSTRLNSRHVK